MDKPLINIDLDMGLIIHQVFKLPVGARGSKETRNPCGVSSH